MKRIADELFDRLVWLDCLDDRKTSQNEDDGDNQRTPGLGYSMAVFIRCLIEHKQDVPIPVYFVISLSRTAGRRGISCKLDLHGNNKQIVRIESACSAIPHPRVTVNCR